MYVVGCFTFSLLADNDFNQAECKYAIDELVECCQQKHARDAVQCSGFQSLIDSHSAIVSSNGLVREIVQEIPEEN